MKRCLEEDLCYFKLLPEEVNQYLLDFMSPSSYYIVTKYFTNIFVPKEKIFYKKGIIMTDAIIYDNVDLIKELMLSKIYFNENINCVATRYESFNILNHTKSMFELDEKVFDIACQLDNISLLNWLKRRNCPSSQHVGSNSAMYGNLDSIKWLHENGYNLDSNTWNNAAKYGYLKILKWGYNNGYHFDEDITLISKTSKILKWLYSIGFKSKMMTRLYLSKYKIWDIDTINWLYDKNCPITELDVQRCNDIKTLEWLCSHGGKLNDLCYENAAFEDNNEMIEWLYDNNCPKYIELCDILAERGNFKMLQWAKSKEFQLTSKTFTFSIYSNQLQILQWLLDNNCPHTHRVFYLACSMENINILKWLKDNNFTKSEHCCEIAAHKGNIEILKWLLDNDFYCDIRTSLEAAAGNNLSILKLLKERDLLVLNNKLFKTACLNNNLEMVLWLKENNCPFVRDRCVEEIYINLADYSNNIKYSMDMDYGPYNDYYTAEKILEIIE